MTIEEMQHKLLSLTEDKVNLRKELEVYKEALESMADELNVHAPTMCESMRRKNRTVEEYYLKKAREELKL